MKALLTFSLIGWLAGSGFTAGASGLELRIGSGERAVERYGEYQYNAAIMGDLTQLASFDEACPGAIGKGTSLRQHIERQREKFLKDATGAGELGIAACLMTDEPSLPIPILERIAGGGAATNLSAGINLDSERFWEVYRAKYREVLKSFPQAAYILVRTGENYFHPDEGYAGRTVWAGAYDDAYFRHMQRLIEETRKIVADEFGRKLIWRTWDLGNDGFHASTNVYDRVLAGLTERKGLIFSIKHTQTDFWRYNDFNPTIGRGQADQIVEFQCAREYEGKGAFPNYTGPLFADDMRKAAAAGAKGVWIWDFEGGWGGPFLKSDRWVRLNIEATTRLAQNPAASPQALAEAWAAKEYGVNAATNVAAMLMLSGECVRKCLYIEVFARDHRGWKPSLNLIRDDIICGDVLKELYDGCKASLPEVYAEKDDAVALATRMRTLFEHSREDVVAARGEREYQESLSSLIYLERLAVVVDHYVKGMFSFYQWQETREAAAALNARQELLAWREAWQRYQSEVPKLPGAATPYRSENHKPNPVNGSLDKGAMADLCESALGMLAGGTSPMK